MREFDQQTTTNNSNNVRIFIHALFIKSGSVGQFEEDLSIYLASQKCSDVLKIIQVIPQEAPAGATLEVRKEALLKRVAYFDKQEMAFGLIAKSFSKCETKLTAECYKIDPTLKPGAAGTERPNGSRLFSTAKTYVLQNAAGVCMLLMN